MQTSKEFWAEVMKEEAVLDIAATKLVETYSYRVIKRAYHLAQRDTPKGRSDAKYEAKEMYWNREEAKRG